MERKKYDHIAGVLKGALRTPWALKGTQSLLRGPRLLEKNGMVKYIIKNGEKVYQRVI